MANTGVLTPSNDPLYFQQMLNMDSPGSATPFQASAGQVADLSNFFTPGSVRAADLTVTVTATGTQQSFAHNLTDAYGNPIAPKSVEFVASTGAVFSSQAPDETNIYLTSVSVADNTVTVRLPY